MGNFYSGGKDICIPLTSRCREGFEIGGAKPGRPVHWYALLKRFFFFFFFWEKLRHLTLLGYLGSINRGPVQDLFFSPEYHRGPFATPQEFHDFMKSVATYWLPPGVEHAEEPYRAMLPDTSGVFLTHGDLHLGNILVAKLPGG